MFLLKTIIKIFKQKKYLFETYKLMILFSILIFSFMFYIYFGTNKSIVDTIYYTAMIMTTVGFGDITPSSDIEIKII
jgi:hypothetical protein